jgi:hypothetical protein
MTLVAVGCPVGLALEVDPSFSTWRVRQGTDALGWGRDQDDDDVELELGAAARVGKAGCGDIVVDGETAFPPSVERITGTERVAEVEAGVEADGNVERCAGIVEAGDGELVDDEELVDRVDMALIISPGSFSMHCFNPANTRRDESLVS